MEIGVLGGAGVAGSVTVDELRRRGHTVRALSRRSGFDVTTPHRAAQVFEEVDALVDCLNPTRTTAKPARAVLVDGLRETLNLAARHGTRHVVSLSIVGIEQLPVSYYRVKLEQEQVVREAPIAGTVVRATQFPALFDAAWNATRRLGVIPAPGGPVAPIDPRDVAAVLADAVEAGPDGPRSVTVRGPDIVDLRDVARGWKAARGSRRPIVPLPAAGGLFKAIAAGSLVDASIPASSRGWSAWLATRTDATPSSAMIQDAAE